ncbi:MAG TPA: dihydrolipoamide acetyltransferase family protein [Roseiflexaceae bacterium]|nr:dihydrolipoamide acetyltransferase family protein [Roseiflexaceae bacterium]
MIEVIMPKVDMAMTEGTIATWRRGAGDVVQAGEPLFEITTDKADVEVEAPASGTLWDVRAAAGQTVPIGQAVAFILTPGEQPPIDQGPRTNDEGLRTKDQARPTEAGALSNFVSPASSLQPPASRIRATPLARKLCRERGIDLGAIQGSGPNGRIGRQDVLAFLEQLSEQAATPPSRPEQGVAAENHSPTAISHTPTSDDVTRVPLAGLRRVIADRMTASVRNAPHFTLNMQVDMAAAVELRRRVGPAIERQAGAPPSFTAIIVRAAAALLLQHPYLNATLEGHTVLLHQRAHIGVALDRAGDLLVPVLRDAQLLTLAETTAALHGLHARAHAHTLSQAELRGSTFTISNLGMYGVDSFTAIINPPESAILAVGRIVEMPVARDGAVVVRPIMQLTLSADHRIVDGAAAARFLSDLRDRLEEPYLLI